MISSTIRTLATFQYLKPIALTQITARSKYAICFEQRIQQILGLPVSPKRPLTAYFQYINEVRKSVVAQNPTLSVTDQAKLVSQMWHSLDEKKKEKYTKAYQNDWIKHTEQVAEYDKTITVDDKRTVKEKLKCIKEEIERRKSIRLRRAKALALGKPKKPLPPFFKFVKVRAERRPSEKYLEYLRRKSSEWKNLSESQKEVYMTPEGDTQNYLNDLLEWKGKMMKLGEFDVLEMKFYDKLDNILKLKKSSSGSDKV